MGSINSLFQHMTTELLLPIFILTLLVVAISGFFYFLKIFNQMTAISILFFISFFSGFSHQSLIIFYIATLVAVIVYFPHVFGGIDSNIVLKYKKNFFILIIVFGMLIIFYRQDIAGIIIYYKSLGQVLIILLIILIHLLCLRHSLGKSIIALSIGMGLAYVGTNPITGAFRCSAWAEELADGISLVVVLSGYYVFTPILVGYFKKKPIRNKPQNSLHMSGGLLVAIILSFFGVGIGLTSILVFGILDYSNISYGALATMEGSPIVLNLLITFIFSASLALIMRKIIDSFFSDIHKQIPSWMIEVSLIIFSFTAIFLSGLGLVSMYLAILFGIIGWYMQKCNIPIQMLLIGFILGKQLEYFCQIVFMTLLQ